jgi:phage terminase large subunit GpA-like protein
VRRIVVGASSQVGKTEMEMNMMGHAIDTDPGPMMFIMPTLDAAQDFSKRRVAPMIRDCKRLRGKVSDSKSRDGNNTVLKKVFPGGMLTITGSNSPAALASTPTAASGASSCRGPRAWATTCRRSTSACRA